MLKEDLDMEAFLDLMSDIGHQYWSKDSLTEKLLLGLGLNNRHLGYTFYYLDK